MKSPNLSEDNRCSDTIAFETTKAVRRRPVFGHDSFEISKVVRMGHESNTATKFTIRAFIYYLSAAF
ncbi:hypothetical protein [Bacillus sp. X1(2014)]|uniref:hypothetical protein n=1 Tax=Bacillus sp. X1(2014) TaxID=1565991 RepID=UPI00119F7FFA|nr:hypothetical protein [Bacillus sp. X1(2014)]